MERKIEYRQLAYILVLFILVQLLGLLTVFYFVPPQELYSVPVSTTTSYSAAEQALVFFAYIIIGTLILLAVFRFYHGIKIYAIIEGIVVVSASFYFFAIVLGSLFPQQSAAYYVLAASIALPILLLYEKYRHPGLRNEVAIIASVGAGVVLGLVLSFFVAFMFMAIIAAYDYISVFVTRHMLTLGREAVNRNMALLIGSSDVELVPSSYVSKKELKQFKKQLKISSLKNAELKRLIKKGAIPIPTQAALGTGDLALPLMLAVSAYASLLSYFTAAVITSGAIIGLVFTMYMLKKYKIGLPAIPPLFAFICIALGFVYLADIEAAAGLFLIGIALILLMLRTAMKVANQRSRSVF